MSRSLHPFVILGFIIFAPSVAAQEKLEINRLKMCSYDGSNFKDDVYAFAPDESATDFVNRIMKYTGLPQNFEIRAANVPNAAAILEGDRRVILYNQSFIADMTKKTHTEWAPVSVMAHEIGHHLSGHTLSELGGKRADKELQADQFSGHVLYQMGASIEQARAAMESLPDATPPANYPPKTARLAAITNGWKAAEDESPAKKPPQEFPVKKDPALSAGEERSTSGSSNAATKRKKKAPVAADADEDDDADTAPARVPKQRIGHHCYDVWANPRCVLIPPGVIGTGCFCYGQGSGVVGP
jgi:hypothetical protein